MVKEIRLRAPGKGGQLLSCVGQFMAEFTDFTGACGNVIWTGCVRCKGGLWELVRGQVVVELSGVVCNELGKLSQGSIGSSHDVVLLRAAVEEMGWGKELVNMSVLLCSYWGQSGSQRRSVRLYISWVSGPCAEARPKLKRLTALELELGEWHSHWSM